jgi:hypothetical protein
MPEKIKMKFRKKSVEAHSLESICDPTLAYSESPEDVAVTPLTPDEKHVFKRAAGIAYEEWHRQSMERRRELLDKLLQRAIDNADKLPLNFLMLNIVQLHSIMRQDGPSTLHQHLHIEDNKSVSKLLERLSGKPASLPKSPDPSAAPPPPVPPQT